MTEPVSETAYGVLARIWQSRCPAHAYLFAGPALSGQVSTARQWSALIHCEANRDHQRSEPCGQCPACRKVFSGNHPDTIVTSSEDGRTLRIDQIRELIRRLQMRPYESRWQVGRIDDAHLMTMEAANALLKTLEEPPDGSILILTTSLPEDLPATIRSRCCLIRFSALGAQALKKILIQDQGLSPQEAWFLIGFCEGARARCLELLKEGFFARRNEVIDTWLNQRNNDRYLDALRKDPVRLDEALKILLSFFRDLLLIKAGAPESRIMNQDHAALLKAWARRISFEQGQSVVSRIVDCCHQLKENLNVKISLMLIRETIWARS